MGYTGKATSKGVSATLNIGGSVVQAYVVTISESDEAKVDELKDGYGEVQGLDTSDRRRRITVDLYPAANSINNAMNAVNIVSVPALVTISNAKDSGNANIADLNSDWVYAGGMTRAWSEGQVKVTLPLWRSLSGANSNVLTTAVT